jgi:hypothetical protein
MASFSVLRIGNKIAPEWRVVEAGVICGSPLTSGHRERGDAPRFRDLGVVVNKIDSEKSLILNIHRA